MRPLFCTGGRIGTLAVNGTVNDLAMYGARPLHLNAGFILVVSAEIPTPLTLIATPYAGTPRKQVNNL